MMLVAARGGPTLSCRRRRRKIISPPPRRPTLWTTELNMRLNILDLFSGIGGITLGLETTKGFETVAFCEIEPFCREILNIHWPEVPIYEDVKKLSKKTLCQKRIDVIVGGFPCQPFSVAGHRKGTDDNRYLWPEFARLVREFRPRWVIAENVPVIRKHAADTIIEDLEELGYSVWPLVVGVNDIGGPHYRKRAWFVAHTDSARLKDIKGWIRQTARPQIGAISMPIPNPSLWISPEGTYPIELGFRVHGLPERLVRRANREALKALGNAVVPQVVFQIGLAILEIEKCNWAHVES